MEAMDASEAGGVVSRGLERGSEGRLPGGFSWRVTAGLALLLASCGAPEQPPVADIRPVRTVSVEELPGGETVTLTGRIEAQEEVRLAFRVGQRLIERKLNVGDRVEAGQLVARLESAHGPRGNLR
jgi:multidrug efflux pump subunit AcrA (membrane-fusion protein)